MRRRPSIVARLALATALACVLAAPAGATAASTGGLQYGAATTAQQPAPGGVDPAQPLPTLPPAADEPDPLPGEVALVGPDGQASAPLGAPSAVAAIIAAGNRIASTPYVWGGGHARWNDRGYDCSGSVSYVLHAAGLLDSPLVSGDFRRWGEAGAGRWITTYSNRTHMYMVVAGLRFDTSGAKRAGTRWQAAPRSSRGFKVRHPAGL